MKSLAFAIVAMILLYSESFSISGTINSTNNHWGAGGNVPSPVIIDSTIIISDGITLTIEPGTQVLGNGKMIQLGTLWNHSRLNPISKGDNFISRLNAIGKVDNFIMFKRVGLWILDSSFANLSFCRFEVFGLNIEGIDTAAAKFTNCIFYEALINISDRAPIFINNTFWKKPETGQVLNFASGGAREMKPTLINNIIDDQYGGVFCFYIDSFPSLDYNLVTFDDSLLDSTNLLRGCKNYGNSNFIGTPNFMDPENGDFHLQTNSPAIDAGDPNSDYSLEPGGGGGRINMGAYGNTSQAAAIKSPSELTREPIKEPLEIIQPEEKTDTKKDRGICGSGAVSAVFPLLVYIKFRRKRKRRNN